MFSEVLWRVVINIKVNNSSLETGCCLAGHGIFKDVNLIVTIVTLRILHSNIQGMGKIIETVVKDSNFFIILVRTECICVT
jgi:hypothetical protein